MIAQFILSILLGGILLYAWTECRRSPAVSFLAAVAATAGIYFVWVPRHSTQLAELVGIGRGVDLILYVWVCISLILLLSLHLKLRMQMEMITMLGRKLALAEAHPAVSKVEGDGRAKRDLEFYPSPTLVTASAPQRQTRIKRPPRRLLRRVLAKVALRPQLAPSDQRISGRTGGQWVRSFFRR